MKKHVLAIITTLAAGLTAGAQVVPIALRQPLERAVEKLAVGGRSQVTVVFDTADYLSLVTEGRADEADTMRLPLGSLTLGEGARALHVADPPHGLELHTSARTLSVSASDDATVTLRADTDTVRLQAIVLQAEGDSRIFADVPLVADELELTASNSAKIEHSFIDGCTLTSRVDGDGTIVDRHTSFVQRQRLLNVVIDHRHTGLTSIISFGFCGWSTAPFGVLGGMASPMGDYTASSGNALTVAVGWTVWVGKHLDLAVALGTTTHSLSVQNAYMDFTTDSATGLVHFGPVAEPPAPESSLDNARHTWRADVTMAYVQLPVRLQWRRRTDYAGWRAAVTLLPGISVTKGPALSNTRLYTDDGRADRLTSHAGDDLINRFALDLRVDLTYESIGLYASTSLTPAFDTKRLDQHIYPVTVGLSLNF